MHIPENYLSPSTCAVLGAVMIPIWWTAVKKVKEEVPREKLPLLGIAAAFSFLSMMFNIPLPGGTTGHAVGGTLIAILFGPYAACLAVSVALFIQALLFGDGGILAFGANCFNMAFLLTFSGYFIYDKLKNSLGDFAAAAIGSYVGINIASFFAAVEFGLQPLLFTDAAGHALYCPYPLSISIPAMMIGHLTIFGLAEVIFTVFVLAYLKKTSPDLLQENYSSKGGKSIYALAAALISDFWRKARLGANGLPKNCPNKIFSERFWDIFLREWKTALSLNHFSPITPSRVCQMNLLTFFPRLSARLF